MRYGTMVILVAVWIVQACSPAPRHLLTSEEKTADLYWLFSKFGENYAPLQYKQERYAFDFEALKAKALQDAQASATNEDFYAVMYGFVAKFRDAHTSASLISASLPARTEVAYLGFSGVRKGKSLLVDKLLPTVAADPLYPIKVKDEITKLDGVALDEVVATEFTAIRNLGQDESNLSYLLPKTVSRNSLFHPMPKNADAKLTVKRGDKELEIVLPWVRKDLYEFSQEQARAAKKTNTPETRVGSMDGLRFFETAFRAVNGDLSVIPPIVRKINRSIPGFSFGNSFIFVDSTPGWDSKIVVDAIEAIAPVEGEAPPKPADLLKKQRNVPDSAIFIDGANTYPAYISPEKVVDADGKPTGAMKLVGYIYVDTFSPTADEAVVLKEFRATLKMMRAFGVKDVLLDLINNGGGSLSLGLSMAQLLKKDRISMPEMQFKVSESWMDEFENKSLSGSDSSREIARRVFEELRTDRLAGKRLSSRWSVDALFPFLFQPNPDLTEDFNLVLMVNELCASMCDIFTATLKDNSMAKIVGAKTMGAGGNVVSYYEAPNSHLSVNQTESLIIRGDGTYLENNGVDPDIAVAVNEDSANKYDGVRAKALQLVLKAGSR